MTHTPLTCAAAPLLLLTLLASCGPSANSPEGVARRYVQAQLNLQPDELIALASRADQAAATSPVNHDQSDLHPDKDKNARELGELIAKRIRITGQEATVEGDRARVQVTTQVPDINLGGLMLGALFGGMKDDASLTRTLTEQINTAPLKDETNTLNLVKEDGRWAVDTSWAENVEAARRQELKREYTSSVGEDFGRAVKALTGLTQAYPNDASWKTELSALEQRRQELKKLSIQVKTASLNQGQYVLGATVTNQNDFPLRSFTVKLTFLNGKVPVGEAQYDRYTSQDFLASQVMGPQSSTQLEGSGEPPTAWTGEAVRADITAFETAQ